jgi:hypothetical protein
MLFTIKSEHPVHHDRDKFTFKWKCRFIVILACPVTSATRSEQVGMTGNYKENMVHF